MTKIVLIFSDFFAEPTVLLVPITSRVMVKFRIFIPELWDFIRQIVGGFSYVQIQRMLCCGECFHD
jgi:hypothetical protein